MGSSVRQMRSIASAREIVRVISPDLADHEVVIFNFSETEAMDDNAAMAMEELINGSVLDQDISVITDAQAWQEVQDQLDYAATVAGIRKGLDQAREGRGIRAQTFFEQEVRCTAAIRCRVPRGGVRCRRAGLRRPGRAVRAAE